MAVITGGEVAGNSRAIVITEVSELGGAERSVLALSRWLSEHGLAHHFVTYWDHNRVLEKHAAYPVPVVQLNPSRSPVKKILALRSYFNCRPGAPKPLGSGYQPAMHLSLAGQKGYHTLMHDTPGLFSTPTNKLSWKGKLRAAISHRIVGHGLKSGGKTIVTSEFLRSECIQFFGQDAEIVRMGGMSTGAIPNPRPVQGTLHMLSVSRVESNKRIDWMLRALASLQQSGFLNGVPWQLDIAGRGSQMDELKGMAREFGLSDKVNFLGFVSDSDLEELYNRSHLFLMPAVQGYGIPAIEALARGIPVLLHRESGVSDILMDTPWATVLYTDESGMAAAAQHAITNVLQGRQLNVPLPHLPTEDEWAERVATLCGWV